MFGFGKQSLGWVGRSGSLKGSVLDNRMLSFQKASKFTKSQFGPTKDMIVDLMIRYLKAWHFLANENHCNYCSRPIIVEKNKCQVTVGRKKVYNLGKHHALVLELYSNGIPKPEKAGNLLQ